MCIFFSVIVKCITHAFAQITTDGDEWVNGYMLFLLYFTYALLPLPLPMPSFYFHHPLHTSRFTFIFLVAKINEIWHMAVEAYSHDDLCCMCVSCVFCVKHAVGLFDLDWYQQTLTHHHPDMGCVCVCACVCVCMSPCDI